MRGIALAICWIILVVALPLLVLVGLFKLAMGGLDILIFIAAGGVVYGLVFAVVASLNARYESADSRFVAKEITDLNLAPVLQRTYGFLLITLLHLPAYVLALSLHIAIAFVLYGWSYGVLGPSRVPIAFVIGLAIVGISAFIAFFFALRHLRFPRRYTPLGISMKRAEQPEFWELADSVAERVLEVGLLSLRELTTDEFSAVLAHEYGHISNQDTRWGVFTHAMGSALIEARNATPGPGSGGGIILGIVLALNPAYWLLQGFVWLYFRVTSAFSRSREVAADVRALTTYGGSAFKSGLMNIATTSVVADAFFTQEFVPAVRVGSRSLQSLSDSFTQFSEKVTPEALEQLRSQLLSQASNPHASHPALGVRVAYSSRFPDSLSEDRGPAVGVLRAVETLDTDLTELQKSGLKEAIKRRRASMR